MFKEKFVPKNCQGADVLMAKTIRLFFVSLIFSFFYSCSHGSSTPDSWLNIINTTDYDSGHSIAIDSQGNSYVTGSTYGDLSGTGNIGGGDIFLAKTNIFGSLQWVRQIGSIANDWGSSISIDQVGNIYLTGSTWGDLSGNGNKGGSDIFIAKYNFEGNLEWLQQIGSTDSDWGGGIAVDLNGYSYITARTIGSLTNDKNAGEDDIIIAKYDNMGTLQWINQIGTSSFDLAGNIVVDQFGNSYIAGVTGGNLSGIDSNETADIFIAKYDTNGIQLWIKQIDSGDYDSGGGIALDSIGNIYVTGSTWGWFPGFEEYISELYFIIKLDANGTMQWMKQLEKGVSVHSIAVDLKDDIFVTGAKLVNLGDIENPVNNDVFIAIYDSDGDLQSTYQREILGTEEGTDLTVDSNGNFYVTGRTMYYQSDSNFIEDSDIFIMHESL